MDNAQNAREAAIVAAVYRICTNVQCEVDEVMLKAAVTEEIDALMERFDMVEALRRVTPHAERVFELLDARSKADMLTVAYMIVSDQVTVDFVTHATIQIAARRTRH